MSGILNFVKKPDYSYCKSVKTEAVTSLRLSKTRKKIHSEISEIHKFPQQENQNRACYSITMNILNTRCPQRADKYFEKVRDGTSCYPFLLFVCGKLVTLAY